MQYNWVFNIIFCWILCSGCNQSSSSKSKNHLIHETSAYLLQHAHNPVDWHPWKQTVLEEAQSSGQLLFISIGYASCHWCHVMEKETFSDSTVAQYMNAHFMNIKVDREELPDVDQVYMDACQLISENCGWPLNIIALPDGRPVWIGTYIPPTEFLKILQQIIDVRKKEPQELDKYAKNIAEGIQNNGITSAGNAEIVYQELIQKHLKGIALDMDVKYLGLRGGQKFPLAGSCRQLLAQSIWSGNKPMQNWLHASGKYWLKSGLMDQVEGGVFRYTTDSLWQIPHFEKMLYDQAFMLSFYADLQKNDPHPEYEKGIYQIFQFVRNQMMDPSGLFYASMDADSEGEEGKYYTWTKGELDARLSQHLDKDLFQEAMHVTYLGNFHKGRNVFYRSMDETALLKKYKITASQLDEKIQSCVALLKPAAQKRVKPFTDSKVITGWNAMMITALTQAYQATSDTVFLQQARTSYDRLLVCVSNGKGSLVRNWQDGKAGQPGTLEDYAFLIQSSLALYSSTFQEKYIQDAKLYMDVALKLFQSTSTPLLLNSAVQHKIQIQAPVTVSDDVIPNANAVLAQQLFILGSILDHSAYIDRAKSMVQIVLSHADNYTARSLIQWHYLAALISTPPYEIAIMGPDALSLTKTFQKKYLPGSIILGSTKESTLPLLEGKFESGSTRIFVCQNKVCKFPVTKVEDAWKLAGGK